MTSSMFRCPSTSMPQPPVKEYSVTTTDDLTIGSRLDLQFTPHSHQSTTPISAKVVAAIRPFTMSPVFHVSIESLPFSAPTDAILKLYDRRCLTNIREANDAPSWNAERDRKYQAYVATGNPLSFFIRKFDSLKYLPFNKKKMPTGQFEAYLARTARKMCIQERATYEPLSPLQGKQIPVLYGIVQYHVDGQEPIPGLLFQYIPSVTLRTFIETWKSRHTSIPPSILVEICQAAVDTVDYVSDFDVLNDDVRMDNILVREEAITSSNTGIGVIQYPVALIDLASCRFRGDKETDEKWVKAKFREDEAGEVGYVASDLIREFVGSDIWRYRREEHRSWRWAYTERSERNRGELGFTRPPRYIPNISTV